MISEVLDSLCLAHNPRWLVTSYSYGWYRLVCSNCGETATCRTKDIPKICPNCGARLEEGEAEC